MATEGTDEPPPPYADKPNTKPDDGGQPTTVDKEQSGGDGGGTDVAPGTGIFGEPRNRGLGMSVAIAIYILLAFYYPPNNIDALSEVKDVCDEFDVDTEYCNDVSATLAGWAMVTIGYIGLIAVAVFGILTSLMKGNRLFGILCLISSVVAVLFCVLGTIVAIAPNEPEDEIAGIAVAYFAEICFVSGTALVLGIDMFKWGFFNDDKKRAIAMSGGFFVFTGFLAGFGYAYYASLFNDFGAWASLTPQDELNCIAAGWLMLFIFNIIRLLTLFDVIPMGINPLTKPMVDLVLAIFIFISGFVACAGYWAFVDYYDVDGYEETQAWIMGLSLFLLVMTVINVVDMGIIKNCQMAIAAGNNPAT